MQPDKRYTYENAGFNNFLLRSLKSNPSARTVKAGVSPGAGANLAFDRMHIGGSMGDRVRFGRLVAAGELGRFIVMDKTETVEVGWIGDLTD